MKKHILVLLIGMLIVACSNENKKQTVALSFSKCQKLSEFVCTDERFRKIKELADSRHQNPLENGKFAIYVTDKSVRQGGKIDELMNAVQGINDNCKLTQKMVEVSENGTTPFIRGFTEETCGDFNDYMNDMLRFVPDR